MCRMGPWSQTHTRQAHDSCGETGTLFLGPNDVSCEPWRTHILSANAPQYNAPVTPRTPLPLRPPRWSINLLCGLSLLIFLLAMGIWVRSYFVADSISRESEYRDKN